MTGTGTQDRLARATAAAQRVLDPELPMLTLADLGVLCGVEIGPSGAVTAWITPTYSGCPAMAEMAADLDASLHAAGFEEVRIRTRLDPPWTSDRITEAGRRKLSLAGIAPPGPVRARPVPPAPVLLPLPSLRAAVPCPRCGSADTRELSRFGSTSCKALWRCGSCLEPFEHVKEI